MMKQFLCNVGLAENEKSPFIIFPNPVNSYLTIEGINSELSEVDLSIVNSEGRIVLEQKLAIGSISEKIQVDVSEFLSGLYIIELKQTTSSNKYRFVKY